MWAVLIGAGLIIGGLLFLFQSALGRRPSNPHRMPLVTLEEDETRALLRGEQQLLDAAGDFLEILNRAAAAGISLVEKPLLTETLTQKIRSALGST